MQVDPIKSTLKPPGTKHLKLICYIVLSSFAFKFNLRRYTEVFHLTLQVRGTGPTTATVSGGPVNPTPGAPPDRELPRPTDRELPRFRLRMDNWIECHCVGGRTERLHPAADVGYADCHLLFTPRV